MEGLRVNCSCRGQLRAGVLSTFLSVGNGRFRCLCIEILADNNFRRQSAFLPRACSGIVLDSHSTELDPATRATLAPLIHFRCSGYALNGFVVYFAQEVFRVFFLVI